MKSSELQQRLNQLIPDAEIQLQGEGCNFSATLISPSFANQKTLARQQYILSHLDDWLRSGELHALTLRTYTPEEWRKVTAAAIVQLD